MVIGLLMGVWETWLWMKEYGDEETRGLLYLHQGEDIEAFRKKLRKITLEFCLGSCRAEMTINSPPPEFLCLCGVTRNRLEAGKVQFSQLKSVSSRILSPGKWRSF